MDMRLPRREDVGMALPIRSRLPVLQSAAHLFRFRLMTLLVVMAMICAWLAWKFHREPISASNVARVQKLDEIPCPDIFKLVYSQDRSRVAFVGWETPVEIRESVTLWPVRTIGTDRKLIDFAFSPDHRRVAYSENSTRAEILAVGNDQPFVLETGDPQPDVVFSPDGKLVATTGYATEAKLWNAATGELVRRLNCRSSPSGLRPAFSPDGRTLAIGDRNQTQSCSTWQLGNNCWFSRSAKRRNSPFIPRARRWRSHTQMAASGFGRPRLVSSSPSTRRLPRRFTRLTGRRTGSS
jgi:WD40 repeat protein